MEELKKQFERGVADRFFNCLKYQGGPGFSFSRAGERPDLVYVNGAYELPIEITEACFDNKQTEFLWRLARGPEDPDLCLVSVGNPDEALANSIVERVHTKCRKGYDEKTIVLIEVPPGHTTAENLEKLLVQKKQDFPPVIPLQGVYVTGRFPLQDDGSDGYRMFAIKENWPLRKADKWMSLNLSPSDEAALS